MPEDTTSPLVMSGITAALSPKLCDSSSRREISAALKTLSTLPSSCWIGTSSGSSARMRKTSGGPFWNPPTALPIPNATGPYCASWEARGRITHLRSQSPSMEIPTQPRRRSHKPSTGNSPPAQPNKIGPSEVSWGTSTTEWIPRTGRSTRGASQRPLMKAGSSTAQGPDGLTMLHLRHFRRTIWKKSVIIPILEAGKPREQSCSEVKILERLILPAIVESLGTRPYQHGFKPMHSTASALLPVSARVVSGFNQRKPPSRTIAITVDISRRRSTPSPTASSSRWSMAPDSAKI